MPHTYYTWRGNVYVLAAMERKLKRMEVRGASISNLSRILSGRHDPGYPLLKGLAVILGNVSLNEVGEFLEHCRSMHSRVHQLGKEEDNVSN